MNILMFCWRGPGHPHAGGAELVTHEHAKAWVKAGHTVTLFTSYFSGAKPQEKLDGVQIIRRGNQVFGVQVRAFLWYLFENTKSFDLVIDHFHGIPFFTTFYVRVKKIAFIHEVAREVWALNIWKPPFHVFPSVIGRFGEPVVFLFYKFIPFVTVSNSTKTDLMSFGIAEKNIYVIKNGVRTIAVNSKKNKQFTLCFLGALAEDKGIEDAIVALSLVKKRVPQVKLWVIGKSHSDYKQRLDEIAAQLKVTNNIVFWGYVTNAKKHLLLSKCHVLVNPSVHEGWGLVNIEANSHSVPVVGYDVSGTRDSVENGVTGVLVQKGNISGLSDEIVKLQTDRKRLAALGKAAYLSSKGYTWEKATTASLSLLKKLCEKK